MQYNELLGKFIYSEENSKIAQREAKNVLEEHAEYEEIIRQCGGLIITETKMRVDELRARCSDYRRQYSENAWECTDQVTNLRKAMKMYKVVQRSRPAVQQFLMSEMGTSSSAEPIATSRASCQDYERFEQQLLIVGRRGRGRGALAALGQEIQPGAEVEVFYPITVSFVKTMLESSYYCSIGDLGLPVCLRMSYRGELMLYLEAFTPFLQAFVGELSSIVRD